MIDSEGRQVSADLEVNFTLPGCAEIYVDERGLAMRPHKIPYDDNIYRAPWHEVMDWLMERKK
jgi:hypothetical protein